MNKWVKLRNFMIDKKEYIPNIPSVQIFEFTESDDSMDYVVSGTIIKQLKHKIAYDDQVHGYPIDNTGVHYWPTEQILTDYIIKNPDLVQDKVMELGAGRSGFCGFALAAMGKSVTITDGNESVLIELSKNAQANSHIKVNVQLLQWGQLQDQDSVAVLSDCFFFEQYHDQLLLTLQAFKKVIGAAPSRGGSLERFLEKCKVFQIEKIKYMDVFIIIMIK